MSSDLGTTTKERRGLEGIRVVECGEGVSAAYAAKLLADLGADVVKVEPPGGDLTRRRGPFPWERDRPREERALRLPEHEQARDRRRSSKRRWQCGASIASSPRPTSSFRTCRPPSASACGLVAGGSLPRAIPQLVVAIGVVRSATPPRARPGKATNSPRRTPEAGRS